MVELVGCGDHSCVVSKPRGMGTNGGCTCGVRSLRAAVQHWRARAEAGGGPAELSVSARALVACVRVLAQASQVARTAPALREKLRAAQVAADKVEALLARAAEGPPVTQFPVVAGVVREALGAEEPASTDRPALAPEVAEALRRAAGEIEFARSGKRAELVARAIWEAGHYVRCALLAHGGGYLTDERVRALADRVHLRGYVAGVDLVRSALVLCGGDEAEAEAWLRSRGAR